MEGKDTKKRKAEKYCFAEQAIDVDKDIPQNEKVIANSGSYSLDVGALAKELSTARTLLMTLAQENARLTKLLEHYMESDDSLLCSSQLEEGPPPESKEGEAEVIDLSLSQTSALEEEDSTWDDLMDWFEREEATQKRLGSKGSQPLVPTSSLRSTLSRSGSLKKTDSLSKYCGSLYQFNAQPEPGGVILGNVSAASMLPKSPDRVPENPAGQGEQAKASADSRLNRHGSLRLPLTPELSPQTSDTEVPTNYVVIPPKGACKHPASQVVRVGIGVLVSSLEYPGCVLIGKRKGSHASGFWGLPGGHLEKGETLEACAEREVLEETGLEVKTLEQQGNPCTWVTNCTAIDGDLHYLTIFIRARQLNCEKAPEVLEPDKCEGWEWCDWSALKQGVQGGAGESRSLFEPLLELVRSSYEFS